MPADPEVDELEVRAGMAVLDELRRVFRIAEAEIVEVRAASSGVGDAVALEQDFHGGSSSEICMMDGLTAPRIPLSPTGADRAASRPVYHESDRNSRGKTDVGEFRQNRFPPPAAENNSGSDRTGKIVLNYGSFATVEFLVSQKWSAPEIALSPASASWEYTGGSGSFSFDIVNPLSDADISVHSNCNWIAEVVSSNHGVSYTVLENNSGSVRDGKIVLNYGSYTVKEFFIHQSWAQSVIKLNPTYAEVGYGGELINHY